jgi:S-adenosylmethionine decarboxylase
MLSNKSNNTINKNIDEDYIIYNKGYHITIDYFGFKCKSDSFKEIGENISKIIFNGLKKYNINIVHNHMEFFDGSNSPPGFTSVFLIDESHISAHCYSDTSLLALDVFTCSPNPEITKSIANFINKKIFINFPDIKSIKNEIPRFPIYLKECKYILEEDIKMIKNYNKDFLFIKDIYKKLENNYNNVYIEKSNIIPGNSYFSKKKFKKNDIIIYLGGILIDKQTKSHSVQIDFNKHIDPLSYMGKYLNHSCNGNLYVNSDESGLHKFIAKNDIDINEELNFEYYYTEYKWEEYCDEKNIKCICGSKDCKSIIFSFNMLTKNEQTKLIETNKIADYLKIIK